MHGAPEVLLTAEQLVGISEIFDGDNPFSVDWLISEPHKRIRPEVSFLPCGFDFENVIDEMDLVVRALKHHVGTSA